MNKHEVKVIFEPDNMVRTREIMCGWCLEYVKSSNDWDWGYGGWSEEGVAIIFKFFNDEDAILFKLTWC